MSRAKSERVMNLTLLLLTTRHWATRDQIREAVEGYHGLSQVNFERTFERDKDELRSLGVPIEVSTHDTDFGAETGYRITRTDFELPPVDFDAAEATVLAVAGQVWQEDAVAQPVSNALAKLRAAGLAVETERAVVQPQLAAREPAFAPLFDAVTRRQVVAFHHRGAEELRVVEPWTLTCRHGMWYLIGFDQGREGTRCFKLSRITSEVTPRGPEGAFEVPPDLDPQEVLRQLRPRDDRDRALLAIREGHAPTLRRRGTPAEGQWSLPEGFALHSVPIGRLEDAAAEICAAAPDVLVVEPADLREAVLAQLAVVAGEDA